MSKDLTVLGQVEECLPNVLYRITLESGTSVIAYLSGKMKFNNIKVVVGDTVEVVLDPYGGKTTNRIVRRK